jgi:drug/metabolite transporter (DMT)-like permease
MDTQRRNGMLYVLMGVLGFSITPIMTKLLQPSGLTPMDIAAWRFFMAAPMIWLVIRIARIPEPEKPLPRRAMLLMGLLMTFGALMAFFGLQYIPAGVYVLLFYSYPTMIALASVVMGEKLPLQSWIAIVLTLCGIALTVPLEDLQLNPGSEIGIVFAFLNALAVAITYLLNARLLRGHKATARASAYQITGAFIIMIFISIGRGGVMLPPDTSSMLLLVGIAFLGTVMSTFGVTTGVNMLGPSRASIISTVEPLLTLTFAAVFLGEEQTLFQFAGGALILISVLLLQLPPEWFQRRQKLTQ